LKIFDFGGEKMKFRIWIVPIVLGSMLLAACGTSNKSTGNTATDTQGAMSLQEQLLVGTFKLEGTGLAVDQTQAATLLTLWQAYKELMSNNATAKEELDAVITQIQDSMTSDQLKAISDMKLTFTDVTSTMKDLGIEFTPQTVNGTEMAPGQGFGGDLSGAPIDGGGGAVVIQGGQGGPSTNSSGPSGGGPRTGSGGGFQGPDSGFATNGNISPEQIATMQAGGQGPSMRSGRIPTAFLNALIDLLQKRSQP
jgi:hypothetical protein